MLYSTLLENKSKMNEILQIQGISAVKRVSEKAISAGIISSVLCATSILSGISLYMCHLAILLPTIMNCFISAILSGFYSCKVNSLKAENIHKAVISMLSIVMQSILLLFV